MSVRKDLDDAYLHVSAVGADEVHVDAMFDEAQRKAVDAVGGVVPNRKSRASCERDLPTGVYRTSSGKFEVKTK